MAFADEFSPMGYQNPVSQYGTHATLAISGHEPDNKGGGILFWAYSVREANEAFDAYRAAGYNRVEIVNALDFESTWQLCRELWLDRLHDSDD